MKEKRYHEREQITKEQEDAGTKKEERTLGNKIKGVCKGSCYKKCFTFAANKLARRKQTGQEAGWNAHFARLLALLLTFTLRFFSTHIYSASYVGH